MGKWGVGVQTQNYKTQTLFNLLRPCICVWVSKGARTHAQAAARCIERARHWRARALQSGGTKKQKHTVKGSFRRLQPARLPPGLAPPTLRPLPLLQRRLPGLGAGGVAGFEGDQVLPGQGIRG